MITPDQASKVREIVSSFDDEKKKLFMEKYASLDDAKKEEAISRMLSLDSSESGLPKESKPDYLTQVKERGAKAQQDISSRGTLWNEIGGNLTSPNMLRKGLGGLQVLGAPLELAKSGVANPSLLMQQGDLNPGRLLNESALGLTGQKQGSLSDVYNVAGSHPLLSGGVELGFDLAAPVQAMRSVSKAMLGVSKLSDGAIRKGGEQLIQATQSASETIGKSVGDAFKQYNAIPVDKSTFKRVLSKIPKELNGVVKEELGQDLAKLVPNIENMRALKQIVGKYRPGTFGRELRGLSENIKGDQINNLYGSMKSVITNTLAKATSIKRAEQLLVLEDRASDVYAASDKLKSIVTDPKLLSPTRFGNLAEGYSSAKDTAVRDAMNIIRSNGKGAKKLIDATASAIEKFNRHQKLIGVAKHVAGAATYGGAVGAAGGLAVRKGSKFFGNED